MKQEFDSAETDRLLEALYGDASDEGSATEALGQLSVSEAADLESLRSVRAMFADMADVDPPDAMTAGLLAAAASAVAPAAVANVAPSKSADEGLWGRILNWFQPLVAHPGLAAAASLALVATIGGVLYMNNRGDLAKPEIAAVSEESFQNESGKSTKFGDELNAAAPAAPPPPPPPPPPTQDLAKGSAATAEAQYDSAAIDSDGVAPPAKPRPPRRSPSANKTKASKSSGGKNRDATKIGTKDSRLLGKGGVVGGTAGGGPSGAASKADVDRSPPLGVEAFEGTATEDTPAQSPASPKETISSEAEKRVGELATLKRQAAAAAERGDCARARALGAKVQKLDRRYFIGEFKTDTEIRACYSSKKTK